MTEPETKESPDTLRQLQELILCFAEDRDWLQFHNPKNLSMAIAAAIGSSRTY